ncbi:MAG: glycosyltransferase family 2 protein [Patescibacteria group bacterium]|jgi:glycosyltransferase involved in cell wall biosynthesis
MKTIAVIPAYNECKTVLTVAQKVKNFVDQVLVVDDGSQDNTYEQLKHLAPNIIVLRHEINLGKGAALKTGCDAAVQAGADYIVCLDADSQHDPKSIPSFIKAFNNQNNQVDVVFGVRQFNNRMPFMMLMGNKALSVMINLLFHVLVHDTQSGFRAFTSQAYKMLRWKSNGYEVETEIIVRMSQHELQYTEVDIDTIYHDSYKGTTALDGVKIFFQILKWKLL